MVTLNQIKNYKNYPPELQEGLLDQIVNDQDTFKSFLMQSTLTLQEKVALIRKYPKNTKNYRFAMQHLFGKNKCKEQRSKNPLWRELFEDLLYRSYDVEEIKHCSSLEMEAIERAPYDLYVLARDGALIDNDRKLVWDYHKEYILQYARSPYDFIKVHIVFHDFLSESEIGLMMKTFADIDNWPFDDRVLEQRLLNAMRMVDPRLADIMETSGVLSNLTIVV